MRHFDSLSTVPTLAVDFWNETVILLCGRDHGLSIGGFRDSPSVEICGHLPRALRKGFKFAHGYWENTPNPGVPWDEKLAAVWHLSEDGRGPRLAIPTEAALMDLLIARREALAGDGA